MIKSFKSWELQLGESNIEAADAITEKLNQLVEASNRQDRAIAWLLDQASPQGRRVPIEDAIGRESELYFRNIFMGDLRA